MVVFVRPAASLKTPVVVAAGIEQYRFFVIPSISLAAFLFAPLLFGPELLADDFANLIFLAN